MDTNFFVTFRSMTCRLWIFLEAAAGGLSRTFVRSSPRRLRATSRLSFTASDTFSAGYSVGIENRCARRTHFWNACRNATDATPKYRQVLWMATFGSCINFQEKRFVKPATGFASRMIG